MPSKFASSGTPQFSQGVSSAGALLHAAASPRSMRPRLTCRGSRAATATTSSSTRPTARCATAGFARYSPRCRARLRSRRPRAAPASLIHGSIFEPPQADTTSPCGTCVAIFELAREEVTGGREIAGGVRARHFPFQRCVEVSRGCGAAGARNASPGGCCRSPTRQFPRGHSASRAPRIPCSTGPSTATRRRPARRARSACASAVRAVSVCGPLAGCSGMRHRPASIGTGPHGLGRARQRDRDFLAGIRPAPDGDGPIALEHDVIGEHGVHQRRSPPPAQSRREKYGATEPMPASRSFAVTSALPYVEPRKYSYDRASISRRFATRSFPRAEPVVLKDLVKDWPAVRAGARIAARPRRLPARLRSRQTSGGARGSARRSAATSSIATTCAA